jgi:hypothetical protein
MVDEGQAAADAAPPAAAPASDWDAADATDGPTDANLGADNPAAAIAQSTRPPSASARPEWRGPPGRLHRSARGGRARLTRCPSSAWSPEQRPLPRSRAVVAGGHGRWQCTRGRGALTRASSNGVVGQAACKLPYATTLWLLDAVARHATAASSDLFCVPFRGARQRARLPTVQTTPPAAPGALYSAFAPQAVLRALPLPAARAEACGCRPPHARRLRVRRPPHARLTPASCVCGRTPQAAGAAAPESKALPSRASVWREE